MWSTNMAMGRAGFAATLGREITEADIEPVNWIQAEFAAAACRRSTTPRPWLRPTASAATCRRGGRRLGPAAHADARRAAAPAGEFAPVPGDPAAQMRRSATWVVYTPPFNMSGQPAISLPLHWNDDGLPIGVQLVAAYGREDVLVRVAVAARGRPTPGPTPPGRV